MPDDDPNAKRIDDLARQVERLAVGVEKLGERVSVLAESHGRGDEQRKALADAVARLTEADTKVGSAVGSLDSRTTTQHTGLDERMKKLEDAEAKRIGAGAAWSVVTSGLSTIPLYAVLAIWYLTGKIPPAPLIDALTAGTGAGAIPATGTP